jgi:hypothetical protein
MYRGVEAIQAIVADVSITQGAEEPSPAEEG